MTAKGNRPLSGVARLRERFSDIKRKVKISPELEKTTREKKPLADKKESEDRKKVALPRRDREADL